MWSDMTYLTKAKNETINNNGSWISHNGASITSSVDMLHQIVVVQICSPY